MIDFKLDTSTHDIVFDPYDIAIVDGVEALKQRLKQRLLLFRGEWFLDLNAGVPYFSDVFIKQPRRNILESAFKREIVGDPEVTALTSFELSFQSERTISLAFTVQTVYSKAITDQITVGI